MFKRTQQKPFRPAQIGHCRWDVGERGVGVGEIGYGELGIRYWDWWI